ncbi:MAG: hypothetical protein GF405_09665, partial [Candidatus Eisenbacteria bacterium]|nr:hypothetical protein [Candidatus Eisenbacteria bacterium]
MTLREEKSPLKHGTIPRPLRPRTAAAFASLGFLALSVQALVLRELLVGWRGNEMSLGIALAIWLGLTGLGSLVGARARAASARVFSGRLALLGMLAPLTLLAARFSPALFGIGPGRSAGPWPLVGAAVCSIAPFAVLAGSLFPAAVTLAGGDRA